MDKKLIIKHLNAIVNESETSHPGLAKTKRVQNLEDKVNKAHYKEVGKTMKKYSDGTKDEKKNSDSVKKYENSDEDQNFHNEVENLNGLEMNKYDNTPDKVFKERALKAIEGDSSMGNSPEYANTVEDSVWGGNKDFGKNLVKRIKARDKKENEDTPQYGGMGDVATNRDKNKNPKQRALSENNTNTKTNTMKRLRFKNAFNGVGNALQLIPEGYKVNDKTFQMTDGNESYEIRWEGTISEGSAVVLTATDGNMINEDMSRMKHLMGYKSEDTTGVLNGRERLAENDVFSTILGKTRGSITEDKNAVKNPLLESVSPTSAELIGRITESGNIEGQTAPEVTDYKLKHADNKGKMVMAEDEDGEDADVHIDIDSHNEDGEGDMNETKDIEGQTAPVVKLDEVEDIEDLNPPVVAEDCDDDEDDKDRFDEVFAGVNEEKKN